MAKSSAKHGRRTILICAVLVIAAVILLLYFAAGIRYLRVAVPDGDGGTKIYAKYFGSVDKTGEIAKGMIMYANGVRALVDQNENGISYSNGDRYEGAVSNLMRTGQGTLYFASGDVYTGSFAFDKMDGHGYIYLCKRRPLRGDV